MLDFIRRQSTSFMAWIILGLIALVFGLQFGLPSDSLTLGADGIAKVYGTEIRNEDYQFQYNFARTFGMVPREPEQRELMGTNEMVIDGMVERLLLAHEARRMGLAATAKQAEDVALDGHAIFLGRRMEWLGPDEKFNYEIFSNLIGRMRIAEPNYLEQQSDELLAQVLRDVVAASVLVPESELRREYEETANTVSLRYARYEIAAFTDMAIPTVAQLDAYVAEHAEELDKRYESQKVRFTGLPKQVRLSLLRVPATDEARAALALARTEVVEGRQAFADMVRQRSLHETAPRGGDYGWTDEASKVASDLPEGVRTALPGLEIGAVSEIIEADSGLWLLQVTARREGDVPKPEALRELAEDDVRDQLARELAQRAAEEDQNAVTAGNALTDVFSQPGALGETTSFSGTPIEALPVEGATPGEGAPPAPAASGDAFAGRTRPKAELRSTGPFPRDTQRIPGLGQVPGLIDAAWSQTGDAELLPEVYEVPGAIVLVGVESKEQASDEGFAEAREELYQRQRLRKAQRVMAAWAGRRCLDARSRGDIKVSEQAIKRLTTYDTDEGKEGETKPPARPPFSVCSRVGALM